jgi:hypothetical protein
MIQDCLTFIEPYDQDRITDGEVNH